MIQVVVEELAPVSHDLWKEELTTLAMMFGFGIAFA
jgi:hypothetical protein